MELEKRRFYQVWQDSLSGLSSNVFEKKEAFRGERPPVDKVISISYSALLNSEKSVRYKLYLSNSYIYCGIQSEHGTLSLNELNKNYLKP